MVYFPVRVEILFNVHLLINFLLDNGIAINNVAGVRCVIYSCGELLIVCLIKLVCSCSGGTNCSVSRSRKYMSVVAVELGESRAGVCSFVSIYKTTSSFVVGFSARRCPRALYLLPVLMKRSDILNGCKWAHFSRRILAAGMMHRPDCGGPARRVAFAIEMCRHLFPLGFYWSV